MKNPWKKLPKYELHIYVGTRGIAVGTINNADRVQIIEDMPPPRVGERVFGYETYSDGSPGPQYSASVVWVDHDYANNIIKVYAEKI